MMVCVQSTMTPVEAILDKEVLVALSTLNGTGTHNTYNMSPWSTLSDDLISWVHRITLFSSGMRVNKHLINKTYTLNNKD